MPQSTLVDTMNGVLTILPEIFRPVFQIFDSNPNPFAKNPEKNQITFSAECSSVHVENSFDNLLFFGQTLNLSTERPKTFIKIQFFELFFLKHRMQF